MTFNISLDLYHKNMNSEISCIFYLNINVCIIHFLYYIKGGNLIYDRYLIGLYIYVVWEFYFWNCISYRTLNVDCEDNKSYLISLKLLMYLKYIY